MLYREMDEPVAARHDQFLHLAAGDRRSERFGRPFSGLSREIDNRMISECLGEWGVTRLVSSEPSSASRISKEMHDHDDTVLRPLVWVEAMVLGLKIAPRVPEYSVALFRKMSGR